ncbi:hypothetical protein ES705_31573 [subsurface metagenome]
MKTGKILFVLAMLIVFSGLSGCSSGKEVSQRRNLMMPQKSELPRNSKYTPAKKKKTYQPRKHKNINKKKKTKKRY